LLEEWKTRCAAEVTRELEKRDWRLVADAADFLARVIEELQTRYANADAVPAAQLARATVRCYTRVLYHACDASNAHVKRRAFEEVWNHLYPRALYRLHDAGAAQDATQQTLETILQKRAQCRDAATFLGWCDQILANQINETFNAQFLKRVTERGAEYIAKEIELAELAGGEANAATRTDEFLFDERQNTFVAAAHAPMRAALLATLRECLDNPRHITVLLELFFNDATFLQLAAQLQTSVMNVQVMKSRALQTLRDCLAMRQLYADWFA